MDAAAMVREVECRSAEALLDEMNPDRGSLWAKTRESLFTEEAWIFRGVACAVTHTLTPSACRKNAFAPFRETQMEFMATSSKEQRNEEDRVIVNFCTYADHMGIHVPGDRPELRDKRHALIDYNPHEFPPIEKLHMAALAQHYGVPTRLLDWTRYPRVAAYFAVEQLAKVKGGKFKPMPDIKADEPCAVWALNRGLVEALCSAVKLDPTIYFITAPAATNPNLAAQGGLFTLVQPTVRDPHPLPDIDVALKAVADQVPEKIARHAPFLVKFTLPVTEARTALRMLAADDVHAGTVWPGLRGVVDWMKERSGAHEWNPPKNRQ
jgi:hypothetical protein